MTIVTVEDFKNAAAEKFATEDSADKFCIRFIVKCSTCPNHAAVFRIESHNLGSVEKPEVTEPFMHLGVLMDSSSGEFDLSNKQSLSLITKISDVPLDLFGAVCSFHSRFGFWLKGNARWAALSFNDLDSLYSSKVIEE